MWDDSKDNTALTGDLFAYVRNSVNNRGGGKTPGEIMIFVIEGTSSPEERLESWSENVGQRDRNVVQLNSTPLFKGTMVEWKTYMGYKERYCVQGTMTLTYQKIKQYIKDKKIQ
jgi:hypothetical protein